MAYCEPKPMIGVNDADPWPRMDGANLSVPYNTGGHWDYHRQCWQWPVPPLTYQIVTYQQPDPALVQELAALREEVAGLRKELAAKRRRRKE